MIQSWKCNKHHVYLKKKIIQIDRNPDKSMSSILNRAIKEGHNKNKEQWIMVNERLKKIQNEAPECNAPTAMQAEIGENEYKKLQEIIDKLKSVFSSPRLQMQYVIQLLFANYIIEIEKMNLNLNTGADKDSNMTAPDMVSTLVKIIMLNRDEDKKTLSEIKKILKNWEIKNGK